MAATLKNLNSDILTLNTTALIGSLSRIRYQISPDDETVAQKFEDKVPVCTSYIAASLQYQTKIAHYHEHVMSMCLSLFDSISLETMKQIAQMTTDIIALFWMPVEFVGDYNTQKLSIKLIVKILECVSNSEKQRLVVQIETSEYVRNALIEVAFNSSNFDQLCRKLLNKFNMEVTRNCAVFSVYCNTAFFGNFKLLKPQNVDHFWIDFNYTSHTISLNCNLQDDINPEELFLRIRIDTLKIDNQFNCIVISPEPAIFTGSQVPAELKNARIAVFTLPPSEIERLKANKDLLSFFSRSQNYTNSEYDVPPTPNTIENYISEDNQMEEGPTDHEPWEISKLLQAVSPLGNISTGKKTTNASELNKEKPPKRTIVKNSEKIENRKQVTPEGRSYSKPSLSLPNSFVTSMESGNKDSSVSRKPKRSISQTVTSKESGYSTAASTAKQDLTIFKKPAAPLQQQRTADQLPEELSKSMESINLKPQPAGQQCTTRRFFKPNVTHQPVTPLAKKNKRTSQKKPSKSTGISPKRKQVNTVKPLNHLTQPDCDPVEANIEYVENGGYFNILRYLKSKSGTACFNEQQREQILKNITTVYENIDSGTRRSNQKAPATSDSDTDSIKLSTKTRRRRRKTVQNVADVADFVPYTQWRANQKEKNSSQSRMASSKPKGRKQLPKAENRASLNAPDPLNSSKSNERSKPKLKVCLTACDQPNISKSEQSTSAKAVPMINSFDRLKMDELKGPSCSKPNTSTNNTVPARDSSSVSSASSCSNHNFQIVESDNDEMATIVDMVCRAEPDHMELSPLAGPLVLSQTKESKHDHNSSVIEASWTEYLRNIVDAPRCCSQKSEIFEELNEFPPADPMPPENLAVKSISDHESKLQRMSIHSSSSSEEAAINCSVVTPQKSTTSICSDDRSKRNQQSDYTWLIDKYLSEQTPQLHSPTCFDTSDALPDAPLDAQSGIDQNVPTVQPQNFTIIQNQFIMSTVRKRKTSPTNEEYPLAKKPFIGDCVPLKSYPQLLPNFVKRLNNEKNRQLEQCQIPQEDVFEDIRQIVDEILESIAEDETAIHETQEQLSSVYEKLKTLIENQRKKNSHLENVYIKLIGRIKAYLSKNEDIDRVYQRAEEQLKKCADESTTELWQDFANDVISSVQERLKRLVEV